MTNKRLLPVALCAAAIGLAACGGSGTTTVTTPAASTTPITSTPTTQRMAARKAHTRARAAKPKAPTHTQCDANIRVKTATTTCPFAQNIFLAYWTSQNYDDFQLSAYSPAAGRDFAVDCASGQTVVCTAGDGAEVSFPQGAADAYSLSQAKRYVSSHDVGDVFPWSGGGGSSDAAPSASTSSPPTRSSTPSYSVPDTSSTPPGANIPNYDEGRGYRVQCADGTFSHSGGIQGACSHHGGLG
jgi:hypothetical protein